MSRHKKYKLIIFVLAAVVILKTLFLAAILTRKKPKPEKVHPLLPKGEIAVVLDDWGYSLNNLEILSKIKYPLTLSVLPGLPHSNTVAAKAHNLGFEVILHLPLEPHENVRLEKNTITTDMDNQKIIEILLQDLAKLPYLKGVSNHMGSKATEDKRVMGVIFNELKKRRFYYLDSFVTPKSVCADLAGDFGLKFARRDIFLDNEDEPAYIKGQVKQLKETAKLYGHAIGIGHDRRVTLEILKEVMPAAEKEG